MRYCLIILLCIACTREPQLYVCPAGGNDFEPVQPITPHLSKSLSYAFYLDSSWEVGQLTNTRAHGLKLPALGLPDYHKSGTNMGVMWHDGLYLHARYYINDSLIVFPEIRISAEKWYQVRLETDPLKWYLDGVLIAESTESVQSGFLTPPYIGKRGVAVANRNFLLILNYGRN